VSLRLIVESFAFGLFYFVHWKFRSKLLKLCFFLNAVFEQAQTLTYCSNLQENLVL
jgi:hypothetical protein